MTIAHNTSRPHSGYAAMWPQPLRPDPREPLEIELFDVFNIAIVKSLLDIFVIVKDKIIPGKSNRVRNFEIAITPLFDSLSPVVEDYICFFRKIANSLADIDDDSFITEIIKSIKSDRERLIVARSIVQSNTYEISKRLHDQHYNEFISSINRIFFPAISRESRLTFSHEGIELGPSRFSLTIAIMDYIIDASNVKFIDIAEIKQILIIYCESNIDDISKGWYETTRIYAKLHLDHISRSWI